MVSLDVHGLMDVARHKEMLADEARLIEESRIEVSGEFAAPLGIEDERVALSSICQRLGPEGDPLREAHGRLVVLVTAVRELLEANAVFAGDSISRIRGTLQLLGRLLPVGPVYDSDLSTKAEAGSGRLVRRTA